MKQLIAISILITVISCNPQKHISGNYKYETECMGLEMDGSQTLKAWGYGKNRVDAVSQAKKNALNDIIFSGISNGSAECSVKPLIVEVNAKEKYEEYFFNFFQDEGIFLDFISMKDESVFPAIFKDRKHAGPEVTYGVVVVALKSQLRKKLIQDNILKN